MPSHKVRLEICGSSYVVSTNDSAEYLLGLAEKLDTDMKEILAEAPNASVTSSAVITALGYLDQAAKNASGADNMRAQLQDYLEEASKAKIAAEEYRREAADLRRQLEALGQKNAEKPAQKPLLNVPEREEKPKEVEKITPLDGQMGIEDF
ncbi:cell division protein ZapA [Ruminococcaceae bacterium OttesenSCG-928-A16]|nr:cell division protein ZapA [Ruminococcaceae bacterium OttesenSCG-928-A16]